MEQFAIQFRLRPVDEIAPWGPEPHLNYYALTDGCYWLCCGDSELFRYTEEVLAAWRTEAAKGGRIYDPFEDPYDAYQVMRLEGDLGGMLAAAIEPVPANIAAYLPLVDSWCESLPIVPPAVVRALKVQGGEVVTDFDDLLDRATGWWRARRMEVMHLRYSPKIWMWRVGDQMTIRWDNEAHLYEGAPVWTAIRGEYELPVDTFLEEVRSFRTRFVQVMRERVDRIKLHWSRPDVKIDLESLEETQREMEASLATTGKSQDSTNWGEVRAAIEQVAALFAAPHPLHASQPSPRPPVTR